MNIRNTSITLAMIAVAATTSVVSAEPPCITCAPTDHLGVAMKILDNKLRTGVYVYDQTNPATTDVGQRVWSASPFQQNPFDPFFVDLPCYGATTDSNLPAGSQIGFNIRADLFYWDGNGPVNFGPVPSNEQLRIKYGFQSRIAGTGTGFVAGFNFQTVPGDGAFHRHLSYFLLGADGNSVPADQDGVQATDGIYLLELELTSTAAGVTKSDPVWIVFRNFPPSRTNADSLQCMALNFAAHRLAFDRAAADIDFDRDVDLDDLAYFQACYTGPQVPWSDPCCEWADADIDGDVDMIDFGLFQRCFAGPNVMVAPQCTE